MFGKYSGHLRVILGKGLGLEGERGYPVLRSGAVLGLELKVLRCWVGPEVGKVTCPRRVLKTVGAGREGRIAMSNQRRLQT